MQFKKSILRLFTVLPDNQGFSETELDDQRIRPPINSVEARDGTYSPLFIRGRGNYSVERERWWLLSMCAWAPCA